MSSEERGDAAVLRHVGVGAGEQQAPVAVVRARRPHLLAVDDPLVAVAVGAGAQPGEVGAGAGLGEQLAPDLRRPAASRAGSASAAPRCRSAMIVGPAIPMPTANTPTATSKLRLLLVEDPLLPAGSAAAARFHGPRDAGPPAVVQRALPLLARLDVRGVGFGRRVARAGRSGRDRSPTCARLRVRLAASARTSARNAALLGVGSRRRSTRRSAAHVTRTGGRSRGRGGAGGRRRCRSSGR